MRSLFILRGAPGSGKSTWVKENHLEPYTLSADQIRRQIQSPVLDEEGKYGTCQDNDGEVWKLLFNVLEKRMERGDLTIVDATHYKSSLISRYKDLENKYRYRVYVVNFDLDEEEIIRRNETRQEWEVVPNDVISKMIISLKDDKEIKKAYKILTPQEAANLINSPLEPLNIDQYERVVIFGDIHGCYEPLRTYFSENPYNEQTCYIFVGDYIDRGIQNKEVLQFLLANYKKPNFVLIEGNHEKWLRIYSDKEYNISDYEEEKSQYKDLQIQKVINELKHLIETYTSKASKAKKIADEIYEIRKEQNADEIFYKFEKINALEKVKEYNIKSSEYLSFVNKLDAYKYYLQHEHENSFKTLSDTLAFLKENKLGCSLNIDNKILDKYNIRLKDIKNNPLKSGEFIKNTLPQISSIAKEDLRQLCRKFIQMSYFEFRGQKYLVTHGGVPDMPTLKTPTYQMIKGVGSYEASSDIDRKFTENVLDVIQIHGHRNVFGEEVKITDRAYNLNSEIEYGKPLRVMEISDHIEIKEYENTVFKIEEKEEVKEKSQLEILKELVEDKLIEVKNLKDNIISINFSREAFYNQTWNERTCTARGLFVDKTNGNIVARSYDKFFNWGQIDSVKSPELKKKMVFPVKCWEKENGFLGLISKYKDEIRFFTKSSDKSDYVNWFIGILCDTYGLRESYSEYKDIDTYPLIFYRLQNTLTQMDNYRKNNKELDYDYIDNLYEEINEMNDLLDRLRDRLKKILLPLIEEGKTYIFECKDIFNDPHIIKYDKSEVVLLDIVTNTLINPEFSSHAELVDKATTLKVKPKHLDYTFNTWDELYTWRQKQKESYEIRHEGWVIEDSNGFRVKMKTRFYSFWKEMRTVLRTLQGNGNLKKTYKTKEEILATKIMQKLKDEYAKDIDMYSQDKFKKLSIIDIENRFYQEYKNSQ